MFEVDEIDEVISRLSIYGAELVDEIVNYEDVYRLFISMVLKDFLSEFFMELILREKFTSL